MITVRMWFTKLDEAAYISLLDLQRVMGRALKRARIPAWYSLGFNPHVYLTFAAPLALGHESMVESMDFKTEDENFDFAAAKDALAASMPNGMQVLSLVPAVMAADKIAFAEYEISWSAAHAALMQTAIESYNALAEAPVQKKTKRGMKTINLKEYVKDMAITSGKTTLLLPAGNVLNINPELLLVFLHGLGGAPYEEARILRTCS